jgi:hypothetical protein
MSFEFLTFFHKVRFFLIAFAKSLRIQGGKFGLRHLTLGMQSFTVEKQYHSKIPSGSQILPGN